MNDPFKMQTPFAQPKQKKKQQSGHNANLVETFRDQGKAATSGVVNEAFNQIFGSKSKNNTVKPTNDQERPNFNQDYLQQMLDRREQRVRRQERSLAQQQRQSETVLFSRKQQETKQQIELLRSEIKKIIKSMTDISSEVLAVEQSVATNPVAVGTYQVNFLERIRRILAIAKKNIQESKNWLQQFNQRQKSRSYYWGQVKKSGTSYLLSNERYMSTQAG